MGHLNYDNKRGSGKKLKVHFDLPDDNDYPPTVLKRSSSSVSSKSSLALDGTDKDDNSTENIDSKHGVYGSPVWSFQCGPVTQSPTAQLMSPPGYDPNRIPPSVFANRPTSPLEWSVASNESLFSIQLGNNSFSRDMLIKTGDFPAPLPPLQEVNSTNEKNGDMEIHSVPSDEAEDSVKGHDQKKTTSHEIKGSAVEVDQEKTEVGTPVLDKTPDDHCQETEVPSDEPKNCTRVIYRSGSDISTRSFQFPILTADGGRTSSSTESEKQEKSEKQQEQQVQPPSPETEKAPKHRGRNSCFCFSCLPCY